MPQASEVLQPILDLISPPEDFVAEDRVLLEAAGMALGGGGALDVPVGKAKFADRSLEAAAGEELSAENATEEPSGTLKYRRNGL